MNFLYRFTTALLLLLCQTPAYNLAAQTGETWPDSTYNYYVPDLLQYHDAVYNHEVKTVIFAPQNRPLAAPVITLNGKEQLELVFDVLGANAQNYSYTIEQCTWNWQPSVLDPFDYIDGFTRDDITNYRYAFNTYQSYVQYRLLFPNSSMRPTKSGNYLLKVYANDNPDDLLLTRRFMVSENQLTVMPVLLTSGITQYFNTHQRINFTVGYNGFQVNNALEEIKVAVLQNNRWDNAITNLQPVFIRRNELVYNYIDQTLFEAGNEFRFFDTRTLRMNTERVRNITRDSTGCHVYLAPDAPRSPELDNGRFMVRLNYVDMNGKFQIGITDWGFTNLDADYTWVHFELPMEKPIPDGNIYIFGALSDWNTLPQFQMHYNPKTKSYRGAAYLKQGLYDYQYVIKRDGGAPLTSSLLEGNFISTENDYSILVYFHAFNSRYDRLVGYSYINSRR